MSNPNSQNQESNQGPARYGLLTWSAVPQAFTGTAPVGGTLCVVKVSFSAVPQLITNICIGVVTAGGTLTSAQNFAGLYDPNGTKLAATADQSAVWNSVGYKIMPLVLPITYQQSWIWVAFYARGTTTPAFAKASTLPGINFGLTATSAVYGTADVGLTTALPAALGAVTATDNQFFVALS